jgi:hypothetical protein
MISDESLKLESKIVIVRMFPTYELINIIKILINIRSQTIKAINKLCDEYHTEYRNDFF